MLLTNKEIVARKIVCRTTPKGERDTTYDATVGEIISCGTRIDDASVKLKSRGVVWVVSSEDFHVPQGITGVATLRTSLAHEGVFALNVGVLDPCWQGPVATALVNFGRDDVTIRKGDPFFRVLFFTSNETTDRENKRDREEYIREITGKSRGFSDTFLNMASLVNDVAKEVLGLPKWAYLLMIAAVVVAILSIFAPIAYTVWSDRVNDRITVHELGLKLQGLEDRMKERSNPEQASFTDASAKDGALKNQSGKKSQ